MPYGIARRSHGCPIFAQAVLQTDAPDFAESQLRNLRELVAEFVVTQHGSVSVHESSPVAPRKHVSCVKRRLSGQPSKLRQVFQEIGRWRSQKAQNDEWGFRCVLPRCPCPEGWEHKRFSGRRMAHIYQCHGLQRNMWKEIQGDATKLQKLIDEGSDRKPPKVTKRLGGRQELPLVSEDSVPNRKITTLISKRSLLQRKLTEHWVRCVVGREVGFRDASRHAWFSTVVFDLCWRSFVLGRSSALFCSSSGER